MTAERRIGKTQVLRKMEHAPPAGWITVRVDLEKIHTAEEFARSVYQSVIDHLGRWKRGALRCRKYLQDLGDSNIGSFVKLPAAAWKPFLIHCVEDLVKEQKREQLVFLWDEMPYMLANISARETEATAMEVLDVLRSLRQEHPSFRMVLTGSIGLHHVVRGMKQHGYSNAPVNDMQTIEVPTITEEMARELAMALFEGEQLRCPDPASAAAMVATSTDCFPFYIHHVVRRLKQRDEVVTAEAVDRVVVEEMLDANDPWELSHFRTRIHIYYANDEPVVMAMLDELATAAEPLSLDEMLTRLSAQVEFDDRDRLLELLKLLERDHYLKRDEVGFRIRFPMFARWWRLDRELPDQTD